MLRLKKHKYGLLLIAVMALGAYLSLPSPLFNSPRSTLLLDKDGALLSARLAEDEQWRFPAIDSVPKKLEDCILLFEDEYFYYHPGINPFSIGRAFWQNINSAKIKSGGSTLSMQVIRLSRKNPPRSYSEKLWEMFLALRLELSYSKKEILNLYASNAPYGGNIVGLETASWRYFKRAPQDLSYSEAAMLAVLPNSPSSMRPGKNHLHLRQKRDRLLYKMLKKKVIDSLSYELSLLEDIPQAAGALPNKAFHLLNKAISDGQSGQRIKTNLDARIQTLANKSINRYVELLEQNEIHNACAIIVSLEDQKILAYVGNSATSKTRSPYVDLIQAERSSGSILKPILYGRAIEKGMIHSSSLLKDVPISINQFSPKNFDGEFEGIITADKALSQSLNVPATLLLKDYGLVPFHNDLNHFGFSSIDRSVEHYGLTLILGGAEVRLFDLARYYAYQAQVLKDNQNFKSLDYLLQVQTKNDSLKAIAPGAWWLVSEALTEVQRPGIDMNWKNYSSSRKIAWKTGTSHGFRDAWAVAYDRNYLVAVWVGNADGEGRPGLTGVSAAGPLMFDLFQLLPKGEWFDKPEFSLVKQKLCAVSGYLPGPNCPSEEREIPVNSNFLNQCVNHQKVLLNTNNELVFRDCAKGEVRDSSIFKLDPVAEYYYRKKNKSSYFSFALSPDCGKAIQNRLGIVYPLDDSKLIIPVNFAGELEQVLFKAHHSEEDKVLFWHLDDSFQGSTQYPHEMALALEPGEHKLLIMDENGNRADRNFKVYVDAL